MVANSSQNSGLEWGTPGDPEPQMFPSFLLGGSMVIHPTSVHRTDFLAQCIDGSRE